MLPESVACRLYVITVLVQTTIDLSIEGDLLVRFNEAEKNNPASSDELTHRKMPVYLSIYALAQWVILLYAIQTNADGVYQCVPVCYGS